MVRLLKINLCFEFFFWRGDGRSLERSGGIVDSLKVPVNAPEVFYSRPMKRFESLYAENLEFLMIDLPRLKNELVYFNETTLQRFFYCTFYFYMPLCCVRAGKEGTSGSGGEKRQQVSRSSVAAIFHAGEAPVSSTRLLVHKRKCGIFYLTKTNEYKSLSFKRIEINIMSIAAQQL